MDKNKEFRSKIIDAEFILYSGHEFDAEYDEMFQEEDFKKTIEKRKHHQIDSIEGNPNKEVISYLKVNDFGIKAK